MSQNTSDKVKVKLLAEKRDTLSEKAANMRVKVQELKEDIEHTKRDIQSRDEQIERKTDQLMSQLQKIKAIDDEKARLLRLLAKSQEERGNINPKDKLQALMLAVQRQNSSAEGSSSTSGESAIMNDLAEMARTSQRLMTRVRAIKPGLGGSASSSSSNSSSTGWNSELNRVKVWYNKTSCTFKVTENHTFRDLLDEVILYWSLQPSKNVLVNAQNFVWPLNASVREVISALPDGKDDPSAIIKVWNRDQRDKVTFEQWILHEDKLQKDREKNEQHEKLQNIILDGEGSKEGGTKFGGLKMQIDEDNDLIGSGGGSKSNYENVSHDKYKGKLEVAYEQGMDVAKLADQQERVDMKGQHLKVSGFGTVNFCKYIDLFIFLLFITLFGNTLFMRRSVYRAGLIRGGVVDILFGDANVPVTLSRSQVLYQGLEVGSQSVTSFKNGESQTELLNFDSIHTGAQIWQWIEGPFRSVATGLVNGTAHVGLDSEKIAKNKLNGISFLQHNVMVGRPKITQFRVQESTLDTNCVKPEHLNLFVTPCLSNYQVGINQDQGIRVGDKVSYHDEDDTYYIVQSIDTTAYRKPTYSLQHQTTSSIINNVNRSEIGTSSWKSINQLTYDQRKNIWSSTDAFTFDHETQASFDNGYVSWVPNSLVGFVSTQLDGGGFSSDVPIQSLSAFDKHMSTLKRNVWIDEKTRAIKISFNMYNANYDFLIATNALFEITPGGSVISKKSVKVVRLCDNWKAEDITRIQLEYVCLGLIIMAYLSVMLSACTKCMEEPDPEEAQLLDFYNTQAIKNKQSKVRRGKNAKSNSQSCTEVCRGCPIRCGRCCGVLTSFWNAVEFVLLIALIVDVLLRWNYQTVIAQYSETQLFGTKYIDLTVPLLQYQTSINLSSLVMFLSVSKCFKYFQLNPSVSLTWRVLSRSAQTFVSFVFIFLIFMMALTLTGYAIFGPHSSDFYTMRKTGVQLFRMVIGGFEYEKLAKSNPWIAPLYFVSVALIGYFILRNLFIAIINDEFGKVAHDVRENGFHWLHKVNPEDRPVHQVTKGRDKNKFKRKINHFPKNRLD